MNEPTTRTDRRRPNERESCTEELRGLVTFYVNGTLDDTTHASVEEHLESCEECHALLQIDQELQRLGALERDQLVAPHPSRAHRLLEEAMSSASESSPAPRVRSQGAWALVAAAITAVVGLGLWGSAFLGESSDPHAPVYRTLTTDGATSNVEVPLPTPVAEGVLLKVVFAPDVSNQEMRAILDAIDGQILSGPSTLGVYSVRAGGGEVSKENVHRLLDADERITFVERVTP